MAIKPLICSCGGISWAELKQWQRRLTDDQMHSLPFQVRHVNE